MSKIHSNLLTFVCYNYYPIGHWTAVCVAHHCRFEEIIISDKTKYKNILYSMVSVVFGVSGIMAWME